MFTDSELLRQYVQDGSEAAFTELVHRYGALVYSAAMRSVGGSGPLAEEITQDVFILLVRKAPQLVRHETLAGWLHTTTRYVALRALHHQRQRDAREQEALAMQTLTAPAVPWEQLRPLLDEAVGQLDDRDRNAVLLRYFQGLGHRDVGAALGLNEDAARMRTERAVEKLRHYFARSGVVTSAALLAEALSANCAQAAPAGLLGSVASTSFAHGRNLGLGHSLLKALYMTTNTKIILTAAVLGAAVAAGWSGSELASAHASPSAKRTALAISAKIVSLSPADALAKARVSLAKILHMQGEYDRESALLDFAAGLDPKALQGLLADLEPHVESGNNKQAISILVNQWAESDPQAALDSLKNIHDLSEREALAVGVFDAWSAKDPAAALAAISQLPPAGFEREMSLRAIFDNMMIQDPKSALSALLSQPIERSSVELYSYIFGELASADPTTAAAAALSMPPNLLRDAALQSTVTAWTAQDSMGALAWANGLPAGPEKNGILDAAVVTLSQRDPASAANYTTQLPSGPIRDYMLNQITTNWAQADPAGLLVWANGNLTGNAYASAVQDAIRVMGQTDPVSAAAALSQISDPNVVNPSLELLASSWAGQDVNAALAWAQSLPTDNTAQRNSAISGVLRAWSYTAPAAAAAYIQQNFATDPSLNSLATQMVNLWGDSDPQAALAWAENLPSGTAQNNAVNAALAQLANFDPQTAWNDAQQLSGSSGNTAMVNVINAWAAQQPDQAAAALANLPEGKTLNTATGDVARNWLNQDPNAASQWIDTLPQGSARDSAVTQLISSVNKNDPASAFNWATAISNETTRNGQVVKLAGQWSNINPAAAAAAAQNALGTLTGLTPAQQTTLQKVVNKAPSP